MQTQFEIGTCQDPALLLVHCSGKHWLSLVGIKGFVGIRDEEGEEGEGGEQMVAAVAFFLLRKWVLSGLSFPFC